jgi:hypothetical protein
MQYAAIESSAMDICSNASTLMIIVGAAVCWSLSVVEGCDRPTKALSGQARIASFSCSLLLQLGP